MALDLDDAIAVLARTPATLRALLADLPDSWLQGTDGPGTWSPNDVVAHLVDGERVAWIPRVERFLVPGEPTPFVPLDREDTTRQAARPSLADLLDTFTDLRAASLARLRELDLDAGDLARRGLHPEFGVVTLEQFMAAWVVHDLEHLGQVARTMARQLAETVGPWRRYLRILGTP